MPPKSAQKKPAPKPSGAKAAAVKKPPPKPVAKQSARQTPRPGPAPKATKPPAKQQQHVKAPQQQSWLTRSVGAAASGVGNFAGGVVNAVGGAVAGAGRGAGRKVQHSSARPLGAHLDSLPLHHSNVTANDCLCSVANTSRGWGDTVREYGNSIKDATGASGARATTKGNPLGLVSTGAGARATMASRSGPTSRKGTAGNPLGL